MPWTSIAVLALAMRRRHGGDVSSRQALFRATDLWPAAAVFQQAFAGCAMSFGDCTAVVTGSGVSSRCGTGKQRRLACRSSFTEVFSMRESEKSVSITCEGPVLHGNLHGRYLKLHFSTFHGQSFL